MSEYIKVAIDAGHGSNTAGKRTAPFLKNVDVDKDGDIDIKKGEQFGEHSANVGVAVFLEEEMKRCNFEVLKVAWDDDDSNDDPDVELSTRQKLIKQAGCKYSVSIHFNAVGDGKTFNNAKGIVVLIHDKNPNDSKALADKVLKRLLEGSKQENRGVKSQALALCNCPNMGTEASILVELGFMTNEYEAQELMANEKFWQECAVEICKGFCDYTGVKYVPEVSPTKTIYRVQTGAFSKEANAKEYLKTVISRGFKDAQIRNINGMYKVQVGAFSVKANADTLLKSLKSKGLDAIITT